MSQLMESKQTVAKGLAFGDQNSIKGQLGYEFVFTRKTDSTAYFSSSSGAETFTLLNLKLDIYPVQMTAPLYQHIDSKKSK
jgi:cyanophycinase